MSAVRSTVAFVMLALTACAARAQAVPPVYAVLFTHIEDNTPAGTLGSAQSRQNYLLYRNALISMGNLSQSSGIPWSLQPDWKVLQAALLYENATLTANTNGKNVLRYLKEDRGVAIDAHSHENGGYNYTDVAHLLDSLGVGGTTVIGGHIWDPSLTQFQEWDRYRVPVAGLKFPNAVWRGDILMGSGTPNHVNDPVVSGVWRPRDRDHYFEDDPTGNILAIGQYKGSLGDIAELRNLYRTGQVPVDVMLTESIHIRPATLIAAGGITAIADTVIAPMIAMRDSGAALPTDFTQLVHAWRVAFSSQAYLYPAQAVTGVGSSLGRGWMLGPCTPTPTVGDVMIAYSVPRATRIRIAIFDVLGRQRSLLLEEAQLPGRHAVRWTARGLDSGVYFVRLQAASTSEGGAALLSRRIVVAR